MLTSKERHPFRPGIAKEWEAEHIHNLTHQERSITIAKRYLIRYIIRRSCCKDETVEHGVNDITDGSSCDQSYQDDIQLPMLSRLDDVAQIPQQNTDGGEAQHTQPELADKRHAPGHTIVLYELYKKPICNTNRLAKAKMGLDVQLDNLIDNQKYNHHCGDEPADM